MAAPVNSVLPAITGTATVGAALALSNGTWAGSPTSYVYAWLRDGVAISGETTAAYTVTLTDDGHTVAGRVTATNVDGSTAADSAAQTVPSILTVEDGTQVAGANSYLSCAVADVYHAKLGNTAWAGLSIGAREAALIKATQYMEQMYRERWKSFRVSSTQTLSWPRAGVLVEDGPYNTIVDPAIVPQEVKDACAEFALKASTADLAPDLTQGVLSETVGPISTQYDKGSEEYTRYRALDALLSIYMTGSSSMAKLVRA